jgi:hypothetical protein
MNTGEREIADTGILPPETDRRALEETYREGLRDLGQLRQSVRENPELAGEIQTLIDQMRRLDPKRFPGNPELVEQLRRQLLPSLEHLELRLRRELDAGNESQVLSGVAGPIPAGYADAVAEYYRKLSRSR